MQRQEDFLVVARWIFARLDQQKPMLPSVLAFLEVISCRDMGVIPAETRWTRHECISSLARWRNRRCALFHRAIYLGWQEKPMPVDDFFVAGMVGHIDGDRLAFSEPQQWPWNLPVVCGGLNGALPRNLQ